MPSGRRAVHCSRRHPPARHTKEHHHGPVHGRAQSRRRGQPRRRRQGARRRPQTQDAHGVHYLRYWVDEGQGKIFCLVDAPDAEAANTVHREAHGLVADEIHPVAEGD